MAVGVGCISEKVCLGYDFKPCAVFFVVGPWYETYRVLKSVEPSLSHLSKSALIHYSSTC